MSRIIVKNLPDQISKEKLKQIFSEKGVVTDVQLKFTEDGKFRKFAFIGFQRPEMADAAKQYYNKSYINTSQIHIETCAELGDPNKPRSWSKYAPENYKRVNSNPQKEKNKEAKMKKLEKSKIKDSKILELLKNHKNDKLFAEFLEVNIPELTSNLKLDEEGLDVEMEKNKEVVSDEKEVLENEKNVLANKHISDSEYIKLKTGVNLNLKDMSLETETSSKKNTKHKELFTVKLSGLPLKVKKSQIKEFLNPAKPYTIRRALNIRGIAYCGFLTEKEMKVALLKNRSFLNNKRIFVTVIKKEIKNDKETKRKWNDEIEKLKNIESVAESGKIFVRNLPYTATEEDLREKFEVYGPISELLMPIDSFTRKQKGFAFVTFLMPEHACRAFNELDGSIFQGRMLHLLPSLPKNNEEDINSDDAFRKNKVKKEKAKSASSINWNTFFIGENALSEVMAAQYNTTKENVLNDKQGGVAVRLALGETQLISKMKQFLEENDVCLEAFENMSVCPRSKTVILVKNLPFDTKLEEIREKFVPFGVLKRVILPPTGVAALVEFIEPSEAKVAFRRISYSKFKHVPMYLEWAPENIFKNKEKAIKPKSEEVETEKTESPEEENNSSAQGPEKNAETTRTYIPVDGATIFVKNLNFSTEDEGLRQHFSSCGSIVSATVAQKKNPNMPGKKLSMGYGFVEFANKESVDKALKTLQFSSLDNHRIELKRSNRTLAISVVNGRKTARSNEKPSSKILVRNVPFQAKLKEISDLFKVFGEIKAVRLPKKMVGTGSHRGFCFIEYNTVQDAKRAFAALSQSTHLYGRRLVLEWAAADDDVATLRKKTALQFKTGTERAMNKITIEDDLGETRPPWASLNRGILLCDECCSVHRNIGRHVSWIRSLHHDWWSPSLLMMVETLNKAGANNVWEHTLMERGNSTVSCKPTLSDPVHSSKEDFIKAKHEDLEFILKTDQETDGIEGLGAQLHAAARTPDLLTSLRLFSQGADPNFFHEEKGSTPLHVAAKTGQALQAELLIIYGADITKKDSSGKMPEECALEAGHLHLANRLKEAKYHVIDRFLQYLCSRKPGQMNQLDLFRIDTVTNFDYCENNEARSKLEMLSNIQFERLVEDVYDEVDRREAENAFVLSSSKNPGRSSGNSMPFLPVHPELSSSRNQGRQKLGRLSNKEFNALILDILQEAKRRDTVQEDSRKIMTNELSVASRLRSEISDEEPLYDSVASDEDYAYADKVNSEQSVNNYSDGIKSGKESEEDLRKSLTSSHETISRLQSEIRLLQDTIAGLVKENRELRDEIIRARSFSRGIEGSTEGEAEPVSETKSQKSTRPTSMYETREGLRYWSGKNEESRGGTQSLYQRQLYVQEAPRYEDIICRTEQVAKRIKELRTAMLEGDLRTFVPCAERIRVAVAELIAIFPLSPPDELIRKLGASTARLQIECGVLQNCEASVSSNCLQQIRNCAYDIAKATKLIVMNAQNG